jgi:hypothetical protein
MTNNGPNIGSLLKIDICGSLLETYKLPYQTALRSIHTIESFSTYLVHLLSLSFEKYTIHDVPCKDPDCICL